MTSFDDIQHPVARETLSGHDAALAQLQEKASELAHMRDTLAGAIGHPGLAETLADTMDAFGGRLQDHATEHRAKLRGIADMQRAEEAAATGEEGPEVERD